MTRLSVCTVEGDDTRGVSATVFALLFFLHVRRILSRKRSRNYSKAGKTKLPRPVERDVGTSSHSSSCEWRVWTPDTERVSTRALLAAWILIHIHDSWSSRGQPAGGLRNNRATSSNSDVNGLHIVSDRYWTVNNDLFVDVLGKSVYLERIVFVGAIQATSISTYSNFSGF